MLSRCVAVLVVSVFVHGEQVCCCSDSVFVHAEQVYCCSDSVFVPAEQVYCCSDSGCLRSG